VKTWDFVYLREGRPWRVRWTGKELWKYFWHSDGSWVSLEPVSIYEARILKRIALPDDKARLYERGVPFLHNTKDGGTVEQDRSGESSGCKKGEGL